MNPQTNKILAAIFVILLIIATQPTWFQRFGLAERFGGQSQITLLTNIDQLDQITIIQSEVNQYTLNQIDEAWSIDGKAVGEQEINQLLSSLKNLEIDSTVSKNPEKYMDFGVSTESAVLVTFQAPNYSQTIIVGDPGNRPNTFFARIQDEETTYLVNGDLRNLVLQSVDQWRDKIIVDFPQEDINIIEIITDTQPITLTKVESGTWQASRGQQSTILGENTINNLLTQISPLKGTGFANEENQQAYTRNSKDILRLSTSSGETVEINFVNTQDLWLVKDSISEEIYTISATTASNILLNSSDIFSN